MSQMEVLKMSRPAAVMWRDKDDVPEIKKRHVAKKNGNPEENHEHEKSFGGQGQNLSAQGFAVSSTVSRSATVNVSNLESTALIESQHVDDLVPENPSNIASGSTAAPVVLVEQQSDAHRGTDSNIRMAEALESNQSQKISGDETRIIRTSGNENAPPPESLKVVTPVHEIQSADGVDENIGIGGQNVQLHQLISHEGGPHLPYEVFQPNRNQQPYHSAQMNAQFLPAIQPLQEKHVGQFNQQQSGPGENIYPRPQGINHPLQNIQDNLLVRSPGLPGNVMCQNINGGQPLRYWVDHRMIPPVQQQYPNWPPIIPQQEPVRNAENLPSLPSPRRPPPPPQGPPPLPRGPAPPILEFQEERDFQEAGNGRNDVLRELCNQVQAGFLRIERGIRVIAGRQVRHRDPPDFLRFASNQSLMAFENAPEDDYQHLVAYLSQIGGTDIKRAVAAIIRATLSTDDNFLMNVTITRRVEGKIHLKSSAPRYLRACLNAIRSSREYGRITEKEFYNVMSSQLKAVKENQRHLLRRL